VINGAFDFSTVSTVYLLREIKTVETVQVFLRNLSVHRAEASV
jgi:hypothetical protein